MVGRRPVALEVAKAPAVAVAVVAGLTVEVRVVMAVRHGVGMSQLREARVLVVLWRGVGAHRQRRAAATITAARTASIRHTSIRPRRDRRARVTFDKYHAARVPRLPLL